MTIADVADKIFVALDTADLGHAVEMASALAGQVGGVKLGKEFFTAQGPDGIRRVADTGQPVFLDLKFHDIPNTVAGAVRAAVRLGPAMLNVHAVGGGPMLRAAVDAAAEEAARLGTTPPKILAVTVLTSLDDSDLADVGIRPPVMDQVSRLARLALNSGLDGVVCSAHELMTLRGGLGSEFCLVVPGIRPAWAELQDQKRVVTPSEALALGADILVIGRPITGADDPVAAARRIASDP